MMDKEEYRVISTLCKDCGKQFEISINEQKRFKSLGFLLPKRCKNCRRVRKQEKEKLKAEKKLESLINVVPFRLISMKDILFVNPSDSLVIIGNGFDIIHGAKSSYLDFKKTIGKNSSLRTDMETYLDTCDLWSNLEESLGKLNLSMFLDVGVLDMWLDEFGAYDIDAQAADLFGAVESTIYPTFTIPHELNKRLRKWVKKLKVDIDKKPFSFLHGDFKVLSFNYTEFIEELYGAKSENVCYIHGCRKCKKGSKPDNLILGHMPGMEEEQWDRVDLKPYKFRNPYKRFIMESAIDIAVREASWYDEATTKKCEDIIKNHLNFFEELSKVKEVYVIGHSLSEVDYQYFEEVCRRINAKWYIGFHSYDDLIRVCKFVEYLNLQDVIIFRT